MAYRRFFPRLVPRLSFNLLYVRSNINTGFAGRDFFQKMQIKIFNIPIGADESFVEEMNHFLRAHKIIDIQKELGMQGGNSCWTFCITYMQDGKSADGPKTNGNGKVDYKEVLDTETFERFSNLRKIRKQIAESEAVPAYAVFTDAELADMAKIYPLTLVFLCNQEHTKK